MMCLKDIIIICLMIGIPFLGYVVSIERRLSTIANDIKWMVDEVKNGNKNIKKKGGNDK